MFEGVRDFVVDLIYKFDNLEAFKILTLIFILISISIFIYAFYKTTSKKDLIKLDLNKYNYSKHAFFKKFFAVIFYFIEYIIIIPLILMLWYCGFSIILFLISDERTVGEILLASAALIGAIRFFSYFKGDLAESLASLFPFIALSVFLLSPQKFNLNSVLEQMTQIPLLMNSIFSFMIVLFFLELSLRFVFTIYDVWKSREKSLE